MIFTWRKVGIQRQLEREQKRKLSVTQNLKFLKGTLFWKMAQKSLNFLCLILGLGRTLNCVLGAKNEKNEIFYGDFKQCATGCPNKF